MVGTNMLLTSALLAAALGSVRGAWLPFSLNGTDPQGRIFNGAQSSRARPWMASFQNPVNAGTAQRGHYCGGALVNPEWVLTTAHCDVQPGHTVAIGGLDLPRPVQFHVRQAAQFIIHPTYQPGVVESFGDIALVRLNAPVFLPEGSYMRLHASPFPNWPTPQEATRTGFEVYGWGALAETNQAQPIDFPTHLNHALFAAFDAATCRAFTQDPTIDPSLKICAGGLDVSICRGDSGGALFNEGTDRLGDRPIDRPCQVGIVSYSGLDVCAREPPNRLRMDVYTFVPAFVDWVATTIRNVQAQIVGGPSSAMGGGASGEKQDGEKQDGEGKMGGEKAPSRGYQAQSQTWYDGSEKGTGKGIPIVTLCRAAINNLNYKRRVLLPQGVVDPLPPDVPVVLPAPTVPIGPMAAQDRERFVNGNPSHLYPSSTASQYPVPTTSSQYPVPTTATSSQYPVPTTSSQYPTPIESEHYTTATMTAWDY